MILFVFTMATINYDLVVPLFLMMLVLRKNMYLPFQNYLLYGLRLYLPKEHALHNTSYNEKSGRTTKKRELTLEDKMDSLFVGTRVTLNRGVQSLRFIKSLTLYSMYDTLISVFVAAFLISTWSSIYQCYTPMVNRFTMHTNMIICASAIIPIHTQLQIMILTGFRAMEVRMSVLVGAIVILIVIVCLSFELTTETLFGTSSRRGSDLIHATATHMNALLLQLSASAPQPSIGAMSAFLKFCIAVVCGALATGCVIPSLHFSRSFLMLATTRGTSIERASPLGSLFLWVDFFSPVVVGVVILIFSDGSPSSLGIILFALLSSSLLRFLCLKLYLQSFLDTVIRSILVPFVASSADDMVAKAPALQKQVETRVTYLAVAAAQYIAHPILLVVFAILMHRSSPLGVGLCHLMRKEVLGLDVSVLEEVFSKELSFDATHRAISVAPHPHLMSAISAFLLGSGMGGISPSLQMRSFFQKILNDLRFLPVDIFPVLGRGIMLIYCITWFVCHGACVLYWLAKSQQGRGNGIEEIATEEIATDVGKKTDTEKED